MSDQTPNHAQLSAATVGATAIDMIEHRDRQLTELRAELDRWRHIADQLAGCVQAIVEDGLTIPVETCVDVLARYREAAG